MNTLGHDLEKPAERAPGTTQPAIGVSILPRETPDAGISCGQTLDSLLWLPAPRGNDLPGHWRQATAIIAGLIGQLAASGSAVEISPLISHLTTVDLQLLAGECSGETTFPRDTTTARRSPSIRVGISSSSEAGLALMCQPSRIDRLELESVPIRLQLVLAEMQRCSDQVLGDSSTIPLAVWVVSPAPKPARSAISTPNATVGMAAGKVLQLCRVGTGWRSGPGPVDRPTGQLGQTPGD